MEYWIQKDIITIMPVFQDYQDIMTFNTITGLQTYKYVIFVIMPIFQKCQDIRIFQDILKGTVSRDFLLLVFLYGSVPPPPAPEYPMANLPLVSTIPAANLPPVSTTPVAIATGINDTGGKIWKQYQAADSIK